MSEKIDLKEIASKWQKKWQEEEIYKTSEWWNKPKFYILDMFPYPSGVGLHVWHPKWYIATDSIARKKILEGYNVLHPMGWDAFGLPAENYALKMKTHPKISTDQNVQRFKDQLEALWFTYDWDREINTTDPKFYKRTQWIFLELYNHYFDEKLNKAVHISQLSIPAWLTDEEKTKYIDDHRLAYIDYKPINRCPKCMTWLANEDLENGRCERCDSEVIQKPMRQWVLRITKYAERLLEGIEDLPEWEDSIKEMQRNWIGKSVWTEFQMKIDGTDYEFGVFTTRVDTVFGMSFVAMAPEHALVKSITTAEQKKAVEDYVAQAAKKTALQRTELEKDKTGVFSGSYAINPFNNKKVPIFIADYVLADYWTGVVMAVPAHDERDYDFAQKYDLPIVPSIMKKTDKSYSVLAGGKNISDEELHAINIEIVSTDKDGFKNLLIPYENLEKFNQILREKMQNWYWNEYSTKTWFHFTFKFKDGSIKEFDLNSSNQDEIAQLAKDFSNDNSLKMPYIWLSQNEFYKDLLIHTEYWILIDSGEFTWLETKDAKEKMNQWLEKNNIWKSKINYKIQDRVFSRQRYWWEPIPMIHCDICGTVYLNEQDLPLTLPEVESYEPTGTEEWPLANIKEWVNVKCPWCGAPSKRETNTMPQWAGSSWYWIRYIDPDNDDKLIDPAKEKYRGQVDVYVWWAEHATRHLIYARFWHKFLHDIEVVSTDEPFKKLQHVWLILAEDGRKMSKRRWNVINPDDVIAEHSTDSMRVYEMFMGPFGQEVAWSSSWVKWVTKFLNKVINLLDKIDNNYKDDKKTISLLHKTIKKVWEDIDEFKFNTAVSQLMILVNQLTEQDKISKQTFESLVILLSPFAPHLSEELWNQIWNQFSIFTKWHWPKYDKDLIQEDEITLPVQVNGKTKWNIVISKWLTQDEVISQLKNDEKLWKIVTNWTIQKVIYVPEKIINLIVK